MLRLTFETTCCWTSPRQDISMYQRALIDKHLPTWSVVGTTTLGKGDRGPCLMSVLTPKQMTLLDNQNETQPVRQMVLTRNGSSRERDLGA